MITLAQLKELGGRLASYSPGEAVFEKTTETVKQGNGRGRWFWELLQNAMDAVGDDKRVSLELNGRIGSVPPVKWQTNSRTNFTLSDCRFRQNVPEVHQHG